MMARLLLLFAPSGFWMLYARGKAPESDQVAWHVHTGHRRRLHHPSLPDAGEYLMSEPLRIPILCRS